MIRNFIYLDGQKLRSLSSQLFEGVVENFRTRQSHQNQDSTTQKGEIGSGRIIADIFSETSETETLTFLDDYAYELFENKLIDENFLKVNFCIDEINSGDFIKITGRLLLNDNRDIRKFLNDFNEVGFALKTIGKIPFSGEYIASKSNDQKIKDEAKQEGLQANDRVVKALSLLLQKGYEDGVDAQLAYDGIIYSAPIKRDYLRENESLIVRKYSRLTQCDFNLLGIVTQIGDIEDPVEFATVESDRMADRRIGLVNAMRGMDKHYHDAGERGVVLDPIAIYSIL